MLDETLRQGRLLPLKDFLSAEHSIYQKKWVPGLGTILSWLLRQAGLPMTSLDKDGRLKSAQLAMLPNLEVICQKIEAYRAVKSDAITDRVLNREGFSHILGNEINTPLSTKEQDILLKYLQRDKAMLTYDSNTVKFKSRSDPTPQPITQEDVSIAALTALIASINTQISVLNTKIEQLQIEAKAAVEHKNKTRAIAALRSKRLAEQTLKLRSDTLYKLEEVYTAIQQAADQVALVQVMQTSAQTLKSLNKQVGSAERVDSIMDDLREQMDETADVQKILQEPLAGDTSIVDEDELDAEFEAMRQEEAAHDIDPQKQAEERKEMEKDAALAEQRIEAQKRQLETERKEDTVANRRIDDELSSSIHRLDALQLDEAGREQTQTDLSEKDRDKNVEAAS